MLDTTMTDPLRIIGAPAAIHQAMPSPVGRAANDGLGFGQVLMEKIAQVDRMQRDADRAVAALAGGDSNDMGRVMLAKQKADAAFGVLLQVRDTLQRAYDEIKQVHV
jgi:flagellar hook-basal body complex protein FliE